MITKYAKKPIPNPNEPNRGKLLCGTAALGCVFPGWHLQAQLVGGHSERSEESLFLWSLVSILWSAYKNEPNFFTANY